jgi:hypothetical protein
MYQGATGNHTKDFASLLSMAVPTSRIAENIAFGFCFKMHTAPAMVGARTVGLFRAAGGYGKNPEFAMPGDWIWEVRLSKILPLVGVVFINARTGQAHVFNTGF